MPEKNIKKCEKLLVLRMRKLSEPDTLAFKPQVALLGENVLKVDLTKGLLNQRGGRCDSPSCMLMQSWKNRHRRGRDSGLNEEEKNKAEPSRMLWAESARA